MNLKPKKKLLSIACWSILAVYGTNDHISRVLFIKYILIIGCWELRAPVEMCIRVVLRAAWRQTPESLSVGFLPREMSAEWIPDWPQMSPNAGDHAWVIAGASQALSSSSVTETG